MELYILRHGIAEDGKPGQSDADRALTAEGKKKLREALKALRRAGVSPDLILSSPYRRARETAAVAASIFGYQGDVVETRALTPLSSPEDVWSQLRTHKNKDRVLISGHEPLLSTFIAYLLDAPSLTIDLKKGSMVRIDIEVLGPRPRALLRWMVVPRLFQKL